LLVDLEEKGIKWYDPVKRLERVKISRRVLELEFEGKRLNGMNQNKMSRRKGRGEKKSRWKA
jgi:hypothetical protein